VLGFFETQPKVLIGIEACGTGHYRPYLAAAAVLPGCQPQGRREVPAGSEVRGIADRRNHRRGRDRSNAGDLRQPPAGLIAFIPLQNQRLELVDLRLHRLDLGDETAQRCPSQRGYLGVLHPDQLRQQIGDPVDAHPLTLIECERIVL